MKNNPISWSFDLWYRSLIETGSLFQFDMYTGKETDKFIKMNWFFTIYVSPYMV